MFAAQNRWTHLYLKKKLYIISYWLKNGQTFGTLNVATFLSRLCKWNKLLYCISEIPRSILKLSITICYIFIYYNEPDLCHWFVAKCYYLFAFNALLCVFLSNYIGYKSWDETKENTFHCCKAVVLNRDATEPLGAAEISRGADFWS